MKMKVLGILVMLLTLAGCIKEDLDPCPVGNVKIKVYAEKFQGTTPKGQSARETVFKERIKHLRYFLYKGDQLKEKGIVPDLSETQGAYYLFERPNLEFGKYTLVLVCNSTQTALTGDPEKMDNLLVTYPGCDDTEDYFFVVFPFTVDCDCETEFETDLYRMHGVIRYSFVNMPADVTGVELTIQNVCHKKFISGDYSEGIDVVKKYEWPTSVELDGKQQFVMGVFPTLPGSQSVYRLKLYKEGEELPFYDNVVLDNLNVMRNQLLDVKATFSDGSMHFDVILDSTWDGSEDGGNTGVE